jgi:hypothetical protein
MGRINNVLDVTQIKVGDKVLVKPEIKPVTEECVRNNWVVNMNQFIGKVLTVARVFYHGDSPYPDSYNSNGVNVKETHEFFSYQYIIKVVKR